MQMTKQSRLSVSAVSGKEWRFIMGLAGKERGKNFNRLSV
ncbi:hypothetical protein ACJ73_05720 [Blastomyces percursus]|uniref:Uncharacterized protein n=1 Tax=Blastomyces percursus TaxID=1658174 RepID=A0A1J9R5N4_9EURO|nr:hypothetical protein ACJ73_05720 [Blastomyces percursus]